MHLQLGPCPSSLRYALAAWALPSQLAHATRLRFCGLCYVLAAQMLPLQLVPCTHGLGFALAACAMRLRLGICPCGQQQHAGGGKQRVGSTTAAGMAAAAVITAVLPPLAATVAMKTPAAKAMAGAQTTINNQLKAAKSMAMERAAEMATTMMMETKATVVAAAAQQQHGGGGSLARAWCWHWRPAWQRRRQEQRGIRHHHSRLHQWWPSSLTKTMGTMKSVPWRGGGECPRCGSSVGGRVDTRYRGVTMTSIFRTKIESIIPAIWLFLI